MRKRLAANQIELIAADVMLPKGNELDLCRDPRSKRWNAARPRWNTKADGGLLFEGFGLIRLLAR